jgi:RNA polymerase sigma factor (sigma-70 family)
MTADVEMLLRIAQAKAARLVGKYGFAKDEVRDIGQDLLADLISRWPKFDPARGNEQAFIRRVMENRLATIVGARHARCRDYRRTLSDEAIEDKVQNSESADPRSCTADETHNLKIDIRQLRAQLPPELAAIAVLLTTRTSREIVRLLGISRSTLYRRIRELRSAAIGIGLDRYIGARNAQTGLKKRS